MKIILFKRTVTVKILSTMIAITSLLLTGCSSKPIEKSYYQLANDLKISSPKNGSVKRAEQIIFIEPIVVASYLDSSGIVLQTDAIKYVTASNHLWISPLSQQLDERIVQDFSQLLPNYIFTSKPTSTPPFMRIKLFIDGFHSGYNGDAVIKGRWIIVAHNGELYTKTFDHHIPLTKNGYESLVAALSTGWQQEEKDFITDLKAIDANSH